MVTETPGSAGQDRTTTTAAPSAPGFQVYTTPTYSPPCPDPEAHAAPLPSRELRYMGRRCQWVISGESVALWIGDMESDAAYRTVFNLHVGPAWRALRRNEAE